jgi:hypothetical protein
VSYELTKRRIELILRITPAERITHLSMQESAAVDSEDGDQMPKAGQLDANMRAARDTLANTRNYCGNRGLAKLLTWIDDGSRRRLVWRDDVEDTTDLDQIPNAHLSLIVNIDDQDCWLAADGAWRGPSPEAPTFADITLSCFGGAPPVPYLVDDFEEAMGNIDDIIRMAGDRRPRYRGLIVADTGEKRLGLNHNPFVVHSVRRSFYM